MIDFLSIHNLFHPNTIDACFIHSGNGLCGGIKDDNGNWNTNAHRDRIVHFREEELRVLSDAFEEGSNWETVKLTSVHANVIINVLKRLSEFPSHVRDYERIISEGLHEVNSIDKGIMHRETKTPVVSNYELIMSGPHIFVANPYYKTPRERCVLNSDYDVIDLSSMTEDFTARTNYTPTTNLLDYKNYISGFSDSDTKWIDTYRMAFRKMVGPMSERTLSGAIIPPKVSHTNGIISTLFKTNSQTIEFCGLCMSLVLDFFMKTIGSQNMTEGRISSYPINISDKYKTALYARTLLLNCLTSHYSDLWNGMWNQAYMQETWCIEDKRLKSFTTLTEHWQWSTPLRNNFERRQALVEIDVIAAMALGLSLQDLEMIYTIQFPVLQQNENDTWYDAEGKIVFTCSKGLTGVGLDRKRNAKTGMLGWEDIRGEQIDENTYAGISPTHTHTIDPAKSELYGGQQQTFVAPYTRCDRIADYRTAWAHFEKVFNLE